MDLPLERRESTTDNTDAGRRTAWRATLHCVFRLAYLVPLLCAMSATGELAVADGEGTDVNGPPLNGTIDDRFAYEVRCPERPDPDTFQCYELEIVSKRNLLEDYSIDRAAIYVAVPEHAVVDYRGDLGGGKVTAAIADDASMQNYPPQHGDYKPLPGRDRFAEGVAQALLGLFPYSGTAEGIGKALQSVFIPEQGRQPPSGSVFYDNNNYDLITFTWEREPIGDPQHPLRILAFKCSIPVRFTTRRGAVAYYVWLWATDRRNAPKQYTLGPLVVNPWRSVDAGGRTPPEEPPQMVRAGPPPKVLIPPAWWFGAGDGRTTKLAAALFAKGIECVRKDFQHLYPSYRILPNSAYSGIITSEASRELLMQLERYGGRAVLLASSGDSACQSLFGFSVGEDRGMIGATDHVLSCDGGALCRLLKGLRLVAPENPPGVHEYFTVMDAESKVLTSVQSRSCGKARITSIHMPVGRGELLALPLKVRNVLADDAFDLADNQAAAERLGLWVAGKIDYPGGH